MTITELALSKDTVISPFHVLLVSLHPEDHALLPAPLSSVDCVVYHAFTCAEAIDILNRCVLPVIVTERTLADGDWTKILQAGSLEPDPAKVIVLSAPGDYQFWADALILGAFDVLYQPLMEIPATDAIVLAYVRWKRSAEQMSARAENMRAVNGRNGRTVGTRSNWDASVEAAGAAHSRDGPAARQGGLKILARASAIPVYHAERNHQGKGNVLLLPSKDTPRAALGIDGSMRATPRRAS
jgi:hypothetical protein